MHASLQKIQASDRSGVSSVAAYYTKDRGGAEVLEIGQGDLARITGYYVQEEGQVQGPGARWYGGSAAPLGLVAGAPAAQEAVERLLQQLDPTTGARLENNGGRRAALQALDLTYAVPKELSILYMLGDDAMRRSIDAAVDAAVTESLQWLEQDAAVVRRGKDGLVHKQASGLLAIATDHATARPVNDKVTPHLHRHVLIMNVAQGPDGKWTALDASRLYAAQAAVAAIAGAKLRELTTRNLGIAWELEEGGNGKAIHRVAGFDGLLRERMSMRKRQVLETALERGLDASDRGQWAAAQRASREGKHECGNDTEEFAWAIEELAAEGITQETMMAELHVASERKLQTLLDRGALEAKLGALPEDRLARRDWTAAAAAHFGKDWDRARAAAAVDNRGTAQIRRDSCQTVGQQKSTWRRQDVIAALCNAGTQLADAEVEADEFLLRSAVRLWGLGDDLMPEGSRARLVDAPRYATRETLGKEALLLAATRAGVGAAGALVTPEQWEKVLATMSAEGITVGRDSDQHETMEALLLGGHRISLVSGQAGTGKTAIMIGLRAAAQAAGVQVLGAALAANAAMNLEAESGIAAFSIAMLLHRLKSGELELQAGAILVVEECSQASTHQLAELWEHVDAARGRLVMIGDQRQLQAVEAGGLYRAMMHRVPEVTVRLDEVRRQESIAERVILGHLHGMQDTGGLSQGSLRAVRRAAEAAEASRPGTVAEVDGLIASIGATGYEAVIDWYLAHDRVRAHGSMVDAAGVIAAEYWDARDAYTGDDAAAKAALILARTNEEARALNQAVRDEAVRRGHLSGATLDFAGRDWLIGERVVGRLVDKRYQVLNGQAGSVEAIRNVKTSWETEVMWPGGHERKVTRYEQNMAGDTIAIDLTPRGVERERERARQGLEWAEGNRVKVAVRRDRADEWQQQTKQRVRDARTPGRQNQADAALTKARGAVKDARVKVKESDRKLDEARALVVWADQLPDAGGSVEVQVTSCKTKSREDRMVVRLDDGTERILPVAYVERHLEGGYAGTTQRSQGATVEHAQEYGLSYVGMSRGKKSNLTHLVVDTTELESVAAEERDLLGRIAEHVRATRPQATDTLAEMERVLRQRLDIAALKAASASRVVPPEGPLGAPMEVEVPVVKEAGPQDIPSFRRASDGWLVRGPVSKIAPGPVTVRRENGEYTAVRVTAVSQPFYVGGVEYADATFAGRGAGLHLPEHSGEIVVGEPSPAGRKGRAQESLPLTVAPITEVLGDLRVVMAPDADALRATIASEIATAWVASVADADADRVVGVARTRAMVDDINEAVVAELGARGELRDLRTVAARTWAPTMPVLITADAKRLGLVNGETAWVVGWNPDSGLTIEMDETGDQVTLRESQVAKLLAQGFATTAARAREGKIEADTWAAVGHGLTGEDLQQLEERARLDLHVEAPDLALERASDLMLRATMRDSLQRDAAVNGLSAHQTVWEKTKTEDLQQLGLPSIQEERRGLLVELERNADVAPEDLARTTIETELITARRTREELLATERSQVGAHYRATALAAAEERIADLMPHLTLVSQRQVSLDPVTENLRSWLVDDSRLKEDRRLAALEAQLADVDAKLDRFVRLRTEAAMADKPDYLPTRGDEDEEQRRATVLAVEDFRARWRITDPEHALGAAPHGGGRLEQEWVELAERLGLIEDLRSYDGRGVDDEVGGALEHGSPTVDLPLPSFRRTADGWVIRGPIELVVPGDVQVQREDGSLTTVHVSSVGSALSIEGMVFVDAVFDGKGAAGQLIETGRGTRRQVGAERRATAQRLAIDAHRQSVAARRQHRSRGVEMQR